MSREVKRVLKSVGVKKPHSVCVFAIIRGDDYPCRKIVCPFYSHEDTCIIPETIVELKELLNSWQT